MRMKLLAPFRTDFEIAPETPIRDPDAYAEYWERIADNENRLRTILPSVLDLSSERNGVIFPHKHRSDLGNRYRSLDADSLERTIHIIEIDCNNPEIDLPLQSIEPLTSNLAANVDHIMCRVYDNGISLIEIDLDLEDWLQTREGSDVTTYLDNLQKAGIELGQELAFWFNNTTLQPLFDWLYVVDRDSIKFIETESNNKKRDQFANGTVLWVTRTLIFEKEDTVNRDTIIEHWLKDSGATTELLAEIKNNGDSHLTRWLNYLFRENAYQELDKKRDEQTGCVKAFTDEWEAMQYAQILLCSVGPR